MTNSTRCTLLAKQACTTLSHVVQKITPPSANNFLKLFFALFAMLTLGITNAWAETVTLNNLGANLSTTSNTTVATTTVGDYTLNYLQGKKQGNAILLAKGTNGGTSFISNKTPIPGAIKSVTVHINSGAAAKTTYHCAFSTTECTAKYSTGSTAVNITGGNSNKYTCSVENASYFCVSLGNNNNGQVLKLEIEYTPVSAGGSDPTITADPTTIDFGTVYQGADVESKTVAVNFENLTGNVTYSGLSTPFTATGTVSNDGDKITISAVASTIGEHSQTLTIQSAADSKTAEVTVKMNVIEKPAPTGTFTLHTGALVEGDYVIVDGTNAMNNTVTSDRLQYNAVTISNNEIVDPLATTIWHIAPNGEYWTIYSAHAEKYAASTNAKNQATLAASVSDNTKWTVTMSGNTFDFENLARSNGSDSGNKYLRKNGSYGFACYASGTGAKLSLYRKAGEKYDVNIASTTNGTVTADPTSAEAGTTITLTVTPDGGYVLDALTVTDASSNPVTVTENKFTMPASDVKVTATFKENEKPAATLTLSKNGETEDITGYKQGDKVTLPSITSGCVKEFVGWSANPTCNVAPEYAAGDSYTLAATAQTLYAVYATAGAGETLTITPSAVSGSEDPYTFTINATGYSLTAKKNSGSTAPTYTSNEVRVYAKGTVTLTAPKAMGTIVLNISTNGKKRLAPITASVGTIATQASGDATVTWTGDATEVTFTVGDIAEFGSENTKAGQLCFGTITVTTAGSYSNYSTTCAAAPIVTVTPETVTANATGAEGKVTVTYENVNTANVAVALYNDAACKEAFTAGWLTASIDADKNITYTVAENTTYAERKSYIQLTAPETTGATDPAVVVIPVTQAAKDKVFASLAELVAADLTAGDEVTVTLNNDVIKEFYIYSSKRCGVVFDVQKDGKDIKIYFNSQTTIDDWAVGGKLSGTLTNVKWTTYSNAWQLAPANTWAWANLTYTEPKAVSTVVVSGAPTKTTYVDGEAFDPTGLTVTVNYNDATTEVNPTGVTFTVTPTTLVKGQTSVSVTATYTSVTSAAYEVTGLTVNDIPTKTVAEFIAAEGGRCYLEGIVSNITNTTYGNFDLTDTSGKIYVYGCLNADGEKQKFAALGVKNGDKIKVIADEYQLFEETKQEAIDVQYVSHISAATITIADITMEVDETKTIAATVVPAEAEITYTIKENAENAISLSDNVITALEEGTATITATVVEGATYLSNSVDFTVTVKPQNIAVLPFTFNGGKEDVENTLGMSHNDLDDDYNSAPKLKFNGVGDNVIIHFDSQAGEFSFVLKQNGQNAGTFTVFESANGEDYTSVWAGGDFGNAQSETIKPTLSATARYVKFEYTTKGNSTNYALGSISIAKPDTRQEAGLAWNPANVSLTVGDAFTAPTLNNPYSVAGITYESSNNEVATVTAEGEIALASAIGTATITATFADGDATYKPATATCTITVNEYIETIDGEWELVTDASKLQAGMEVIVAQYVDEDGEIYTMGSLNKNNRYAVESSVSGNQLTPARETSVLTLVDGGNGTFALQIGSSNYLCAAATNSNYLKEVNWISVHAQWKIAIKDGKATIKAVNSTYRNLMCYNSSSKLFSCYDSANPQQDIALYAKKPAHTRTTSAGRYGTICLPGNIVKCLGATLYEVAGKDGLRVVFDEVLTPEAGMPYIFLTHNAEVLFYCGDQTAATPGDHKSLHGTFTVLQNSELEGKYMIQNNKIVMCDPANSGVAENRAYFDGYELNNLGKPSAQMPGRRRITMGAESENETTGTEEIVTPNIPVTKKIVDGQLIIIRDGEMYNAQGQRL